MTRYVIFFIVVGDKKNYIASHTENKKKIKQKINQKIVNIAKNKVRTFCERFIFA